MKAFISNKIRQKSLIQFIKFGIVGVTNTFIGLGIYYIFVLINKNWYQIGNIIGWLASVAWSCYWNNRFVFSQEQNSRKQMLKRLGKSYVSYGFTFFLTVLLLHLEIEWWKWSEKIAPLVNLIITIPLNFLLNKYWTFKVERNRNNEEKSIDYGSML